MKPVYQKSKIPFLRNKHPLVMAHRGRSAFTPKSSFQSFKEAYALNVDVLETDIRLTRDNIPVIFHDETLDRTTNGKGKIIDYSFEELQEINLGYMFRDEKTGEYPYRESNYRIVSLSDFLEKFPKIKVNLDIKDEIRRAPKVILDVIRECGSENKVMIGSFHHKQLVRFRKLGSRLNIPTSASPSEVLAFIFHLTKLRKRDYCAFQVPMQHGLLPIVTENNIKRAHKLDLAVHTWTINNRIVMEQLLDWNIDGIFTDDPELLIQVMGTTK